MKRKNRFSAGILGLIIFFLVTSSLQAKPYKHVIEFGGPLGYHYYPDYLEVYVGDTIEWKGDLSAYWLESVIVPSGAENFSADSVPSFTYVVKKIGEYTYQNPFYNGIGMKGIIIVDTIKDGLTNEG